MWGLTKVCGIVGETVVLWVFVVCEVWWGGFFLLRFLVGFWLV